MNGTTSGFTRRRIYLLGFFALVVGCTETTVTSPHVQAAAPRTDITDQLPLVAAADSAAADSLARLLALALADVALRKVIVDDLRDSPFPEHRLQLSSYLSGTRGKALASSMAAKGSISVSRVVALASTRGGLQLLMRRSVDRLTWTGSSDIAVKGNPYTLIERRERFRRAPTNETAYTVTGAALPHGIMTDSRYPYLEVGAAETRFGADPEIVRAASPKLSRSTIGTPEEEFALYRKRGDSSIRASQGLTPRHLDECPPEGCGDGGPPRPMGVSIPSGKTYADCYKPGVFDQTVDRDQDGVDDLCEYELAKAFRPQLRLMQNDCDTRRAPYFAVRQKNSLDWGGVIFIFYAVSYFYDCGAPFYCPSWIGSCTPHAGDTEWIILEVGPAPYGSVGPWALKYGTLSAHWRTDNDQTSGYEASDLEDADSSPGYGAPRVWIAQGKHGSYRTEASCDGSGLFNLDNCDYPRSSAEYATFEFESEHNLGKKQPQFQFIGSNPSTPVYDRYNPANPHYEFFWNEGGSFCGWDYYPSTPCAGSYFESLDAYGF